MSKARKLWTIAVAILSGSIVVGISSTGDALAQSIN